MDLNDLPWENVQQGLIADDQFRSLPASLHQAIVNIANANRRWTSADIASEIGQPGVTAGVVERAIAARGHEKERLAKCNGL